MMARKKHPQPHCWLNVDRLHEELGNDADVMCVVAFLLLAGFPERPIPYDYAMSARRMAGWDRAITAWRPTPRGFRLRRRYWRSAANMPAKDLQGSGIHNEMDLMAALLPRTQP